jgi:hypothetical protein
VGGCSQTQKEKEFDETCQVVDLNERGAPVLQPRGDDEVCEEKYDICVFLLMWGLEIYHVE